MNKDQAVPLLIILLSFLIGFFFIPIKISNQLQIASYQFQPLSVSKDKSKKGLQLGALRFITPKPIPKTSTPDPYAATGCDYDSIKGKNCSCPVNQKYSGLLTEKPEQECYFVDEAKTKVNSGCSLLKLCEKSQGECDWKAVPDDTGLSHFCIVPESITGKYLGGLERDPDSRTPRIDCVRWKKNLSDGNHWCVGKPVIYLYPGKPTLVDVKLSIPGDIYISIPNYPAEGGWQNVLAKPDGQLIYDGNNYKELYYETNVSIKRIPRNGIIIPTSSLKSKLLEITGKLGLKPSEQEEFLQYWLPKLYELKKNYIVFSLIEQDEKERIDGVDINPKPDVFINFLAYFKGIDYPIAIEPLTLPTPPARSGFTAVEWGGTIDPQ